MRILGLVLLSLGWIWQAEVSFAETSSDPCPPIVKNATIEQLQQNCQDYQAAVQAHELQDMVNEGNVFHLIIGRRGTEPQSSKLPKLEEPHLWYFGDREKPDLTQELHGLQITLDFNRLDCLRALKNEQFQEIIFDSSTWRFFDDPAVLLPEFARLLKPGGRLVFERPNAPNTRIDAHMGEPVLMYIPNTRLPHHFSISASVRRDSEAYREAVSTGTQEIDRRYQAHTKKLGFRELRIHIGKRYPIPTKYYHVGIADYYEFIK